MYEIIEILIRMAHTHAIIVKIKIANYFCLEMFFFFYSDVVYEQLVV